MARNSSAAPARMPAHVARAGLGARDDPVQARAVHPVHAARLRLVGPALLLELPQQVDGDDPLEHREAEPVAVAAGHSRVGILVASAPRSPRQGSPACRRRCRCILLYCPNRHGPPWSGMKKAERAGSNPGSFIFLRKLPSVQIAGKHSLPEVFCRRQGEVLRVLHRQDAGVHAAAPRGGGERVGRRRTCTGSTACAAPAGTRWPGNDCRSPRRAGDGRAVARRPAAAAPARLEAVEERLAAGDHPRVRGVLVHLELQVRLSRQLLAQVVGDEGVRAAAEVAEVTWRPAAGPAPRCGLRRGSSGRWASTSCSSRRGSSPAPAAGSPGDGKHVQASSFSTSPRFRTGSAVLYGRPRMTAAACTGAGRASTEPPALAHGALEGGLRVTRGRQGPAHPLGVTMPNSPPMKPARSAGSTRS